MSGSLFKVSKLTARYPLQRSDLYKELVPSASNVWFHPTHVFISSNNRHKLTTFEIAPQDTRQDRRDQKCLDLTFDLSPLHDVLFGSSDSGCCKVFLIAENGLTQVWSYQLSNGWEKLGTFELCTHCTSNVSSVIVDNRGRCFYWCEEVLLDDGTTHKICKRSFPTGHNGWTNDNVEDAMVLLEDCLSSDLYVVDDDLYILSRQPCPSGLIVKWLPLMRCLEVHIFKYGCILVKNEIVFRPPSFRDIAMSLVDLWMQNDEEDGTDVMAIVPNPLQNDLYIINRLGEVCSVKDTKELKTICRLVVQGSLDSRYFMCQSALCELSRSVIRFYSLTTGQVKQTIETKQRVGDVVGAWSTLSGDLDHGSVIQSVGFYTAKDAFQILMTDSTGWTVEPENIKRMKKGGQPIKAAQRVIDEDKKGQMNGDASWDVLTNGEEFESLAIPVICLQQRNKTTTPSTAKQMEKFLEDFDVNQNRNVSTELNDSVNPQISEYVKLQQEILSHLNNKTSKDPQSRKVEDEVFTLIATDDATDLLERRVQLETLAKKYPEDVLAAIMKYLNNDTDDTSRTEMKKWKEVLATEPNASQPGYILPLYEITCRLLFRDQPSQLVKFVKVSHSMSEQGFGMPGFTRKTTSLYDRALDAVPDVSKSSVKYDAVVATARLLLLCSRPQREHEALHLLLSNEVWESAITLVAQQEPGTELHCELFNILFVESLKLGFLAKYTSDIMDLIPERIGTLYLLDLMKTHLQSAGNEEVFCNSSDVRIKVSTIRPYLMKFLEK